MNVGAIMKNYTKPLLNIMVDWFLGLIVVIFKKSNAPIMIYNHGYQKIKYPILIYNHGFQFLERIK